VYVLAVSAQGFLNQHQVHLMFHQVRDHIMHNLGLPLRSSCLHPLRIGLYQLETTYQKDILLVGGEIEVDGFHVDFVNHDQALNKCHNKCHHRGDNMALVQLTPYPDFNMTHR
jgi:hypothetical protein